MIFNENGEILNNSVIMIDEFSIDLSIFSRLILESESEQDRRIKELEDALRSIDNKEINKIKSPDIKFKTLSEKAKKIISKISMVSGLGGIGGLVGGVFVKNKVGKILVMVSVALAGVFLVMQGILGTDEEKENKRNFEKRKYQTQLYDLIKEACLELKKSLNNKNISDEDKNKILDKIIKMEAVMNDDDKAMVDFYNDGHSKYKIGGYDITETDITIAEFHRHKDFYERAIKTFNSKFKSELNRISDEITKIINDKGYSIKNIEPDYQLMKLHKLKDNECAFSFYLWADTDYDDFYGQVGFFYTTDSKFTSNWDYN